RETPSPVASFAARNSARVALTLRMRAFTRWKRRPSTAGRADASHVFHAQTPSHRGPGHRRAAWRVRGRGVLGTPLPDAERAAIARQDRARRAGAWRSHPKVDRISAREAAGASRPRDRAARLHGLARARSGGVRVRFRSAG